MALALAASLLSAVPGRADLVVEAPDLTVTPGSSGSFDVLLVNTNATGGASYNVAADSLGLALTGPPGITFTDASINTVVTYIYVTSGTTVGGGPFSFDTFPNTMFTASDSEFASPGFRTVNPGDTFGLAHVSFAVSAGFIGTDTIALDSSTTSLSDPNGNGIPVTLVNGLLSTSAIPEPSALTQAATAVLIGLGVFWWRRRKRQWAAAQ
jgi:hypothetical protein